MSDDDCVVLGRHDRPESVETQQEQRGCRGRRIRGAVAVGSIGPGDSDPARAKRNSRRKGEQLSIVISRDDGHRPMQSAVTCSPPGSERAAPPSGVWKTSGDASGAAMKMGGTFLCLPQDADGATLTQPHLGPKPDLEHALEEAPMHTMPLWVTLALGLTAWQARAWWPTTSPVPVSGIHPLRPPVRPYRFGDPPYDLAQCRHADLRPPRSGHDGVRALRSRGSHVLLPDHGSNFRRLDRAPWFRALAASSGGTPGRPARARRPGVSTSRGVAAAPNHQEVSMSAGRICSRVL